MLFDYYPEHCAFFITQVANPTIIFPHFTLTYLLNSLCNMSNFQLSVDCCDGSDEYDGKVKCPNTCWEAGKVARDKLNKKIATYQEGVTLRKQEVERAKLGLAKDEAELSKLKDEEKILKGLVQQLKGMVLTMRFTLGCNPTIQS